MESQPEPGACGRAYRPTVALPRRAAGVAAVMAVGSFSFLVFGPLADQRATSLAALGPPPAVASAGPSSDLPRRVAALQPPMRDR